MICSQNEVKQLEGARMDFDSKLEAQRVLNEKYRNDLKWLLVSKFDIIIFTGEVTE